MDKNRGVNKEKAKWQIECTLAKLKLFFTQQFSSKNFGMALYQAHWKLVGHCGILEWIIYEPHSVN